MTPQEKRETNGQNTLLAVVFTRGEDAIGRLSYFVEADCAELASQTGRPPTGNTNLARERKNRGYGGLEVIEGTGKSRRTKYNGT